MGQQQLLLVILVTIIVGIATVVAITTFSTSADAANMDAVRQDMVSIVATSQTYFIKPDMLGGGGRNFNGMTFQEIGFPYDSLSSDGLTAFNGNGQFTLDYISSYAICLTSVPNSDLTKEMHVDIYESDLRWYDTH